MVSVFGDRTNPTVLWLNITQLHIYPINLHLASFVRIPSSVNSFQDMLPT